MLLLNMCNTLEFSGLFVCLRWIVKFFSAWGTEKIAGLWFARGGSVARLTLWTSVFFNLLLKIFWKKYLYFWHWYAGQFFWYLKWYILNMLWYILIYSNLPWYWVFHDNNTNHLPTNDQIIISADAQVFYICSF